MATETFMSPAPSRRLAPWRLLVTVGALVALVALVAVAVEIVAPLSAGLPIGWGQLDKPEIHLRVGTPPLWNVVADTALSRDAAPACGFAVVASPLSDSTPQSTVDMLKAPRWMAILVTGPCGGQSARPDTQANLWQPTGQDVMVAGQRAPLLVETVGAPQISYRVDVASHGFQYRFLLQDPSAAQARRDLPDFLTFVGSFRYTS